MIIIILYLILTLEKIHSFNVIKKYRNKFTLSSKLKLFSPISIHGDDCIVSLVGNTNVGKSSLFNRMTRRFDMGSLVSEVPNTTRDPNVGFVEFNGKHFKLIDTPGISLDDITDKIIQKQVEERLHKALEESTMSIFVVDGQVGLTNLDKKISEIIRNYCKNEHFNCVVAVNKCESQQMGLAAAQQFWNLGLGEPIPCSALHGFGVAEVLEKSLEFMPQASYNIVTPDYINIALVGRPNTGKSSIANKMINFNRFIVSPIAGTTVDSVDSFVTRDNSKTYRIIDTCGISQNTNTKQLKLQKQRTLLTIRQADVCILVIDSSFGISKNELDIAKAISEESKPAIIVCNKWDLIDKNDGKTYNQALNYVKDTLNQLDYANVIFTSAHSGQRVEQIFDLIDQAHCQYLKQFPGNSLNEIIQDALFIKPPKLVKGKRFNIYYTTQIHTKPPGFVLFCNNDKLLTKDYDKYLENTIRNSFKISGTPIKIYKREKRLRNVVKDMRAANNYIFKPKNVEFGPSRS